eukprot:jgi/Ulvmu1/5304/UM022_0098.1
MSGTLCQTLYMTSLALGSVSQVDVDISTPGIGSDNGMAICFMGAHYNLTDPVASVQHALGGHQFDMDSEVPLRSVDSSVVTFASLLQQDQTFTSHENLRTFHHNWGSPADNAVRLPEILFRHDMTTTPQLQCGQTGASWLACPSQCFNVSGTFPRNTRHHFRLTVSNPPVSGPSTTLLPTIWATPLKHSHPNGTIKTTITGQSKTGAVCTGPVLHSPSAIAQNQLFDACDLSSRLAVYASNGSEPEPCIAALQAHVQSLVAAAPPNATQTDMLPAELRAPPLLSPWPPSSTVSTACPLGSAASARAGHGCISCEGGAVTTSTTGASECECGPASVRLPVGPRACSDVVHTGGRPVSSLQQLPHELCSFFKQEYNSMLMGEVATEVVATEYGHAFLQLAWPLLDVDTYAQLYDTYYPGMLYDTRYPDTPTRERGVWNICSTCNAEGKFKEGRSKKWESTHDWRFQAAHVFRFIGFVLDELGSGCSDLFDPENPKQLHYGPYNAIPCIDLPDARSHMLPV